MRHTPDHRRDDRHLAPWREGLAAARANLAPGSALIGCAVLIVIGYHLLPPLTAALDRVAQWKIQAGLIFGICSTALFGGVIPLLIEQVRPGGSGHGLRHIPFLAFFWATKGLEIDLLYRAQAAAFGESRQIHVILTKVFFDQFGYVPLWAVPSTVLAYAWMDHRFDAAATARSLGPNWYRRRVLPVMIANWGVWVPTVAVIYTMRLPLQLPVQNIVLCLWSIVILFMVSPKATPEGLEYDPHAPIDASPSENRPSPEERDSAA